MKKPLPLPGSSSRIPEIHELPVHLQDQIRIFHQQEVARCRAIADLKAKVIRFMETISYRKLILGDDVKDLRIKAAKSLLALYDLTRAESVPFRFWIITTAAANFLEGGDIPSAWRVARAMDFAAMRTYRSGVRRYEGRSRKFKRLLAMDVRGYKLRGRIVGALRGIQVVYDNRKLVLDHYGKKIIPKFGGHLPNCVPQLKSPAMEPDKTKIKEGDL